MRQQVLFIKIVQTCEQKGGTVVMGIEQKEYQDVLPKWKEKVLFTGSDGLEREKGKVTDFQAEQTFYFCLNWWGKFYSIWASAKIVSQV